MTTAATQSLSAAGSSAGPPPTPTPERQALPAPANAPRRQSFPPIYENAASWHRALGDVPLERIIFDVWPGTATEADLLYFVESGDRPCELIDGTLVEKSMGWEESQIATQIAWLLMNWVVPRKLGHIAGEAGTIRTRSGHIRLPDVAFISTARFATLPKPLPAVPLVGPELVVEVLSESNRRGEMQLKLSEYFETGTQLVWFVDPPSRTVMIYVEPSEKPLRTLTESDTLDGGNVLPGFEVKVSEIFNIAQ